MIVFTLYRDINGTYKGYSCKGHAGYADSGQDIVCAAVSILCINTANAIESFTPTRFSQGADSGFIHMMFESVPDEGTLLLMRTLELGMQGIRDMHPDYVDIIHKEVT